MSEPCRANGLILITCPFAIERGDAVPASELAFDSFLLMSEMPTWEILEPAATL